MEKENTEPVVLIDGDSLLYFEMGKNTLEEALLGIDERIMNMLDAGKTKRYAGFLTIGKCFRYKEAKTRIYKGNRKRGSKPIIFYALAEYLKQHWQFTYVSALEADDLVAIYSAEYPAALICSPDKDVLHQVEASHYNYRTSKYITTTTKQSDTFLWKQMLMGDSTDGIVGIPKLGVKTADKLLDPLKTKDMPTFVLNKYIETFGIHEGISKFGETFKLVYILRSRKEALLETGIELDDLVINKVETAESDELWA
tara:strand:- start:25188 stop:25952 length:765 start_codon:yes stop_codon:yes gene_type:complete